jgi:hypothetical protein
MGIADAGTDMTPQSAVPATKPIARAFTGHLPSVAACREAYLLLHEMSGKRRRACFLPISVTF